MVVHEHDRRGRQLERPFHHLAHIDGSMIDRAGLLHFIGDDLIALVEEQDAELGQAIDPKSGRPEATMLPASHQQMVDRVAPKR
jgi:hypothetical protein